MFKVCLELSNVYSYEKFRRGTLTGVWSLDNVKGIGL